MSSKKLVDLVNRWSAFEELHPEGDLADFCRMYLAQSQASEPDLPVHPIFGQIPPHALIGRSLGRLTKLVFFFSKKALYPLGLHNVEDFSYLETVRAMGNPKKSEVILSQLSEFTSGIEILKRLHKLELITEADDPNDKRSKRVSVTEKGLEVLGECKGQMMKVGHLVFDHISDDEKRVLIDILMRLDEKVTHIYEERKHHSFDEPEPQN